MSPRHHFYLLIELVRIRSICFHCTLRSIALLLSGPLAISPCHWPISIGQRLTCSPKPNAARERSLWVLPWSPKRSPRTEPKNGAQERKSPWSPKMDPGERCPSRISPWRSPWSLRTEPQNGACHGSHHGAREWSPRMEPENGARERRSPWSSRTEPAAAN